MPNLLARHGGAADQTRGDALDAARGRAGVASVPQVRGDHDRPGARKAPVHDRDRRVVAKERHGPAGVGSRRNDHDRRAGDDAGPLREELERPVALGALVLVVVVARAQMRRGARTEGSGGDSEHDRGREDPPRAAPREIGEKGEHRIGHNA